MNPLRATEDPSLDSRPSVLSTCPEVDIADVSEGWPDSRAVANRLHPDSDLCDTASTITSRHTVGKLPKKLCLAINESGPLCDQCDGTLAPVRCWVRLQIQTVQHVLEVQRQ